MASSSVPHHHRQHHQRVSTDPRKRWDNDHHRDNEEEEEAEEGELRGLYQQQQLHQLPPQKHHHQLNRHGNPRFRHRFQPPSPSSSPAPPPHSLTSSISQDFQQRFRILPTLRDQQQQPTRLRRHALPEQPQIQSEQRRRHQQLRQHQHQQQMYQSSPQPQVNDYLRKGKKPTEYFIPLSKGGGNGVCTSSGRNAGPAAADQRRDTKKLPLPPPPPGPPPPIQSRDPSSVPWRERWRMAPPPLQRKTWSRDDAGGHSYYGHQAGAAALGLQTSSWDAAHCSKSEETAPAASASDPEKDGHHQVKGDREEEKKPRKGAPLSTRSQAVPECGIPPPNSTPADRKSEECSGGRHCELLRQSSPKDRRVLEAPERRNLPAGSDPQLVCQPQPRPPCGALDSYSCSIPQTGSHDLDDEAKGMETAPAATVAPSPEFGDGSRKQEKMLPRALPPSAPSSIPLPTKGRHDWCDHRGVSSMDTLSGHNARDHSGTAMQMPPGKPVLVPNHGKNATDPENILPAGISSTALDRHDKWGRDAAASIAPLSAHDTRDYSGKATEERDTTSAFVPGYGNNDPELKNAQSPDVLLAEECEHDNFRGQAVSCTPPLSGDNVAYHSNSANNMLAAVVAPMPNHLQSRSELKKTQCAAQNTHSDYFNQAAADSLRCNHFVGNLEENFKKISTDLMASGINCGKNGNDQTKMTLRPDMLSHSKPKMLPPHNSMPTILSNETEAVDSSTNSATLNHRSNGSIGHSDQKQRRQDPSVQNNQQMKCLPACPPHRDAEYTASLHWKNYNPSSPPRFPKRPVGLPPDVEHITDVEWADGELAATHQSRNASSATNVSSAVGSLERAPRPKPRRPEPCFCEPDLVMQAPCCVDTSCALFACQEECTTSCAAGPLCRNKRIQRREWKKLSVFDAGLKGRGLMVQERCRKGDFIVEYVGVAVKKQCLDGLFSRYRHERMLYIMALDGDVYIDARHRGGIARYINHSCDPNCAVHRWKVRGISRAGVFALREIREGEELSFDYQWERKRGRALTKCHCGSDNCRGTIELEKNADERLLEEEWEQLEGLWIQYPPSGGRAGNEIMNRVVKVYFEDFDEYYLADVAQYDETSGNHLLMYRGDPEEHWTDLSSEKWMLLDEPGPRYAIARKNLDGASSGSGDREQSRLQSQSQPQSLLIGNAPTSSGLSSNVTSPRSDFSRSSSPQLALGKGRNYIYVQTPVKDAMVARHSLFKCSRHCRVHIDTVSITVPRDDVCDVGRKQGEMREEDDDGLKKAYEQSEDGVIWKLVVTGMEVKKAIDWLEKVTSNAYDLLGNAAAVSPGTLSSALPTRGSSGMSSSAAPPVVTILAEKHATEVIIPRTIVDAVKKKYYSLKGYCYNVDVGFSHSDSKSKQFAKMTLASESASDMDRSLEYLYGELTQMCLATGAPMTNIGVYKDLAFLGGELSSSDYRFLFNFKRTLCRGATTDCSEDLHGSTFAQTFMEANRCSIWVQAEEDMGRVSNNRVINESYSNKPRRIFFGVAPSRVALLWEHLRSRVKDMRRGVQFLHLGADRIYQPALLERIRPNGQCPIANCTSFFDFVEKMSGASVRVDSVTGGSHLRIDGGDSGAAGEAGMREANERIHVAMDLIGLQIEMLRDHHIRRQRWGFGRDWALFLERGGDHTNEAGQAPSLKSGEASAAVIDALKAANTADSVRFSGPRAVGTACLEISDIVTGCGLSEKVAAHACIIFYRYINLIFPPSSATPAQSNVRDNSVAAALSNTGNFKLRDVQLASLFIANKSQKVIKWKRLEVVLEHAYRVFYPGSQFDPASMEAKNWERRVIKAEKLVLSVLNYDVFWRGVDWVVNAVVGTKAMAEPLAENAMALALSGHVLAAGPVLWLKYGPKYAFAAIAGFLSISIEPLFPALALQPLTVSHAAELIYHSCRALSRAKKSTSLQPRHELFGNGNVSLMGTNIRKVQGDCAAYMSKHRGRTIDDSKFVSSPAYREISERAMQRRAFCGVGTDLVEEELLPKLGKICFESKCTVRFADGMSEGTNDIVLEGSWKALSIAENLMREAASLPPTESYEPSVTEPPGNGNVIKQVKIQPGLFDMKKIDGKNGWYGALDSSEMYDAGWKTCVAASAPQEHLDSAGLRWWVPQKYGPSLSGSLCEVFALPKPISRDGSVDMRALAKLAQSFAGGYSRLRTQYPALAAYLPGPEGEGTHQDRCRSLVAFSLQRWPPEKIEAKERLVSGHENMEMGFSVAALQEMQLLHQLHFLIPSPQGHPNFILPLAIALDSYCDDDDPNEKESPAALASATSRGGLGNKAVATNAILAMIVRNRRATSKRRPLASSGSHLVLEPTPLNLQKVMSRYQRKGGGGAAIPPIVLASWCHDILSAVSFCHSNHIVLRSLLPDQIHLDHCGTAKLSGLSKVMVLHGRDRTREFDPLKFVRSRKGSKDHSTEDVEPFAAPELLLGGTRHTKETDMWALGALLANLLVGRQLFPGKDRVSKMTQVFKIVGVPGKDNYERAKEFPLHSNNMYVLGEEGKKKKYGRGVEKALRHMLKAFGDDCLESDYSGLICLIDSLLHLDPKKRMSADDALQHQYMMSYSIQIDSQDFRQSYVSDWLDLKENVLTKRKKLSLSGDCSAEQGGNAALNIISGSFERKIQKRKAFSIAKVMSIPGSASAGEEGLYDLEDISCSSKKKKISDM